MAKDDIETLRGLRVMVVEDNYVLAESMRWALEGLGCEVIGPAPTSERALELLASGGVDVAVLDIDLQGKSSAPVAERLQDAGLPFLFLTGYESAALLPDSMHDRPCLTKPVDPNILARALVAQIAGKGPAGPAPDPTSP